MVLIKYTIKAIKDLEIIYENIALDKKSVAEKFVNKIDKFIQLLEINPQMGIDCREKGFNRDCRILYYGNYTILYKTAEQHISIQRVLNTKQKYKGK